MRIEIGPNEAGQRLDKFLRKLLKDVPLSAIFKALRKKDIRVNGKKQNENYHSVLLYAHELHIGLVAQKRKQDL